jgi:hypothetical protein
VRSIDLAELRPVDFRNGSGTVRALTSLVRVGRFDRGFATGAIGACRDVMRALAILVVLSASWQVGAQPSDLAFRAPASCPTEASVRARIAHRLGGSLDEILVSGIDIAIARDHGRFVARIDLRALTVANDIRTLTSAHCDELADAVAVVVARVARERAVRRAAAPARTDDNHSAGDRRADDRHADDDKRVADGKRTDDTRAADDKRVADGKRAERTDDTRADDKHAAAPPVVATRTDDDEPAVERTVAAVPEHVALPPRLWSLGMRLSGVSGIGVVPEVGLGAELALAVRHDALLAELAETWWMRSGADAQINGPGHVDVGLRVTAARVGWRPENLPLRGFAAAEVGTMSGVGVGVTNPEENGGRWFAAGAGFGVAWQMTRWVRLVGSTEVLIAIERVRFALGNGVIVYAPSPMSARASCGIEVGWQ